MFKRNAKNFNRDYNLVMRFVLTLLILFLSTSYAWALDIVYPKKEKVNILIQKANDAGGKDNITVNIVEVDL